MDSSLHTRLAIVTANELGLAFPPKDLPKKFRPDPSTFYLVIVVTNRQTDRQTNAGDSIIPRESFRGDIISISDKVMRSLTIQIIIILVTIKTRKTRYRFEGMTDLHKIWHSDAGLSISSASTIT